MAGSDYVRWMMASAAALLLVSSTALGQVSATTSADRATPNIGSTDQEIEMQVETARQYVIERDDKRAMNILDEILRKEPSNRTAKLELARVLGYREDYKNSDRLYHELLNADANDEAASLGLIRNLLRQQRTREVRKVIQEAQARHPNSILLQEYEDRVATPAKAAAERDEKRQPNLVQVGGSFLSDSAGNRSSDSSQLVEYQFNRFVGNHLRLNELSLWNGTAPKANVLTGTDGFQFQLTKFLTVLAEGGAVRYADQSTKSIYRGDVELRPYSRLEILGGYSRTPISPSYDSAQFDLHAEGWHAGLNWHPRFVRIRASFSRENYSDGNRADREHAEIIRWSHGSKFALGAGYEFSHDHFLVNANHGYFSPDEHRRHLAEAGFYFRIGKVFRAEYLGRGGVESISNGDWMPAGEVLLRNRFSMGKWHMEIDYSRMQLLQSSGAYSANSGYISLGYAF